MSRLPFMNKAAEVDFNELNLVQLLMVTDCMAQHGLSYSSMFTGTYTETIHIKKSRSTQI